MLLLICTVNSYYLSNPNLNTSNVTVNLQMFIFGKNSKAYLNTSNVTVNRIP